jgi:hypothetical protein
VQRRIRINDQSCCCGQTLSLHSIKGCGIVLPSTSPACIASTFSSVYKVGTMFGTKQISKAKKAAKKAPPPPAPKKAVKTAKKVGSQIKKAASSAGARMGGAGYRKFEGDALWLPNTTRPDWLDGSLPGMLTFFSLLHCSFCAVLFASTRILTS